MALVNDGLFWFVVLLRPLLVIFLCAVIAMPSEGRRADHPVRGSTTTQHRTDAAAQIGGSMRAGANRR
jgi:hypothetical protein